MRKMIILLVVVFVTLIVTSCTTPQKCSAYGEQGRYQRNPNFWNRK